MTKRIELDLTLRQASSKHKLPQYVSSLVVCYLWVEQGGCSQNIHILYIIENSYY